MSNDFWRKHYNNVIEPDGFDALRVYKSSGSDWTSLEMKTNDRLNGTIQIRSKQQLETLHFMIGQLLGND